MILFTAVFCALLMIFEVPLWIPHAPRFIKVSCEVLIFLLWETAICVSLIANVNEFLSKVRSADDDYLSISDDVNATKANDGNATETDSRQKLNLDIVIFTSWSIYLFILGPAVNALNHLFFIYHCILNASVTIYNQMSLVSLSFACSILKLRRGDKSTYENNVSIELSL